MTKLLESLTSAADLHQLSLPELNQLADEIRDRLCGLLSIRTAHFRINLGVVELCLALHSVFDFRTDRLIWDTGHQNLSAQISNWPQRHIDNIRTRGGMMGYPNPAESPYDLFMTGHAGCSVSTALGLKSGDDLRGEGQRRSVAVIGDGAFPSGIVFEALNNAGELNCRYARRADDNKMSICPRVGSVARYLDRLRHQTVLHRHQVRSGQDAQSCTAVGDPAERMWRRSRKA